MGQKGDGSKEVGCLLLPPDDGSEKRTASPISQVSKLTEQLVGRECPLFSVIFSLRCCILVMYTDVLLMILEQKYLLSSNSETFLKRSKEATEYYLYYIIFASLSEAFKNVFIFCCSIFLVVCYQQCG